MLARQALLIAGLAAIAGCRPAATTAAPPATRTMAAVVARYVDSLASAQHLPALSVTIVRDGRLVVEHAVGYADVATRRRATPNTRFRIGSVSKLITATTLLRLTQSDTIDLDAPLSRWLAVPPALGAATLRQLAGHTAGVRHYRGAEFLTTTHYDRLADALGVFANDSLLAPPGTRYFYSSYGFNLIGAALEAQQHATFPAIVARVTLQPLGMRATVPDVHGATIADRASLYTIAHDSVAPAPDDDLSGRWPSGGYLSTTGDLARLGATVIAPGFLTPASLAKVATPQTLQNGTATAVGIGWRIAHDRTGRLYLHHGGSSNGGSAFVLVYPAERLVIAMAGNALGTWGEREALRVIEMVRSEIPRSE